MVRARPGGPGLQDRGGQVRGGDRRDRECTSRAGRCWSARSRSRSRSGCQRAAAAQGHPARGAERQAARARGGDHRPGGGPARSRSPPTWPAAASTSCWAATRRPGRRRSRSSAATTRGGHRRAARDGPARGRGAGRAGRASVVATLGGLHIVGTERHEARRIDNQLRGRAGRQGDPGSSRFYVSLEDELMRRFGGSRHRRADGQARSRGGRAARARPG